MAATLTTSLQPIIIEVDLIFFFLFQLFVSFLHYLTVFHSHFYMRSKEEKKINILYLIYFCWFSRDLATEPIYDVWYLAQTGRRSHNHSLTTRYMCFYFNGGKEQLSFRAKEFFSGDNRKKNNKQARVLDARWLFYFTCKWNRYYKYIQIDCIEMHQRLTCSKKSFFFF